MDTDDINTDIQDTLDFLSTYVNYDEAKRDELNVRLLNIELKVSKKIIKIEDLSNRKTMRDKIIYIGLLRIRLMSNVRESKKEIEIDLNFFLNQLSGLNKKFLGIRNSRGNGRKGRNSRGNGRKGRNSRRCSRNYKK
jgi:hypothetical protein